jgi:hypothetical protein
MCSRSTGANDNAAGRQIAPALLIGPEKLPRRVARRSFGITKPLSLLLDWRFNSSIGAYWFVLTGPDPVKNGFEQHDRNKIDAAA